MKKVVVGISGGVDSAVATYLLKKQGFEVTGVFMQNWDSYLNRELFLSKKENLDVCDAEYDFSVAKKVCEKLNVKLYRVNFIKEYWNLVFEPFLEEYRQGLTPNPDIWCNKYIKFGAFHDFCVKNYDCDYIATGHYARVGYEKNGNFYQLKEAKDQIKDQTYFLCSLNQKQLSKTWFPLGDLTKTTVRKIANEIKLDNWNRKDSTGICFIGERNFKKFLHNYIANKPGPIVDIHTKKNVGFHNGIHLYTIGQRKGLNLGGNEFKYFVCQKDVSKNIIFVVSEKDKNKYLNSTKALVNVFNWIGITPTKRNVQLRFRHTKNKVNGSFSILDHNSVLFDYEPTEAVTMGQYVAVYQDGVCLGGGPISKVYLNYGNQQFFI